MKLGRFDINRYLNPGEPTLVENPPSDLRSFFVTAHFPGRKVTKVTDLAHALDYVRCAFASGATHIELEPEWQFRKGTA